MAKITSFNVVDLENSVSNEFGFYTLKLPYIGDRIAFLPFDWGGVIRRNDYLEVIPVVVSSTTGKTYISRLCQNTFTAAAVEGTRYPQLSHSVTKTIAYCGLNAITDFAKSCKYFVVENTYNIRCKRPVRNGTYSWVTLGLGATDESYIIDNNCVTIGGVVFTKEDVVRKLAQYGK